MSNSFVKNIQEVVKGNEELISDYTFIASKIISNKAKLNNFKAMLSGMGADEAYGGYTRYKLLKNPLIFKILGNKFIRICIEIFINFLKINSANVDRFISSLQEEEFCYRYARLVGYFNNKEIKKLWG